MIEGSGKDPEPDPYLILTDGIGRHKNIRILRILVRIPNTDLYCKFVREDPSNGVKKT
jgi:hypothetical protein